MALTGKNLSVASSGAAVSLDSGVKVTGSKVSLGSGSGNSASASGPSSKPDDPLKPVFIRMRLLRNGSAGANVAYTLTLDTGLVLNGSTDGDGRLEQKVPATAATAKLQFTDTGEIRNLVIGSPEPVDTLFGAQLRLKRLGLYHGTIDGRSSPLTVHALSAFQKAQGIDVTGKNDAPTQAALKKAYGS